VPGDGLVWENTAIVTREDEWTELVSGCDAQGRKIYLEIIGGKLQADWAEVVFADGEAQVVDFGEKTHGAGLYELIRIADGRKVDHVRMVARTRGDETRVTLKMEK
jgi:hypothetical protein